MNWIEIFRTGTHTDSAEVSHRFNKSDLDYIVTSFDPKKHEPPLVIGHPKTDAPAWGWVSSLKRDGEKLFASFKDVPDTVQKLVCKGRYKKRSISLFPDGRLRHVGLLGAAVPAVLGMQDILAFNDTEEACTEFSISTELPKKHFKKATEKNMNLEELQKQVAELMAENKLLKAKQAGASYEQIKELEAQITRLHKDKIDAEAAKEQAEADKTQTEQAFAAAKTDIRRKELTAKVDALIQEGKILPKDKQKVLAFASNLDSAGELEFSESEGSKPVLSHFFDLLSDLPSNGLTHEFSASLDGKETADIPYNEIMNKV